MGVEPAQTPTGTVGPAPTNTVTPPPSSGGITIIQPSQTPQPTGTPTQETPTDDIEEPSTCTIHFEDKLQNCKDERCRTEKAKRVYELLSNHEGWWGAPPSHILIAAFILEREGNSLVFVAQEYMSYCIYDLYKELVCGNQDNCASINMDGLYKWMGNYTVTFSPAKPFVGDFDEKDWEVWQNRPSELHISMMESLFDKKYYELEYIKEITKDPETGNDIESTWKVRKWWTLSEVDASLLNDYTSPCYFKASYQQSDGNTFFFGSKTQFELKDKAKDSMDWQNLRSRMPACG